MKHYTVTVHRSVWSHDSRDIQFSYIGDIAPQGFQDFRILNRYIMSRFAFCTGWELVR